MSTDGEYFEVDSDIFLEQEYDTIIDNSKFDIDQQDLTVEEDNKTNGQNENENYVSQCG